MIARAKESRPLLVLAGLTVLSLAGVVLLPPIPQDQSYHQFADQRALLGIPNFWNVVSNLPFIVGRRGRAVAIPSQCHDRRAVRRAFC